MKFTTPIAMIDPSFYIPLARAAEEAGFDSIAVPDSIAYPQQSSSKYPYNPDGTREFLENKPFLEPMIAIAAMGVATERIEFHTFVLKMPMRHPVMLAKEATSVAVLTDNRLVLGVGTSPWPDDYEILGLPWERRGRRFDECIDIVQRALGRRLLRVRGRVLRLPADQAQPDPDPPIPILIGGHSDANLRRAARRVRRLDGGRRVARGPHRLDHPHPGAAPRVRPRPGAVRHLRHQLRLVQPRRHQTARGPRRHAHLRRVRPLQPVRRGGRSRDPPGEDRQRAPVRRRRDRQSDGRDGIGPERGRRRQHVPRRAGHPGRRPRAPRARRPPPAQRRGDGGRRRRDPRHPPPGAAGGRR